MRVGVLGAGSWGTTLADLLARNGHDVLLWAYEPEVADGINAAHLNEPFLPGCPLAAGLRATNDAAEAAAHGEMLVSVIPSHVLRATLRRVEGAVAPGTVVVSATKGIEQGTLALMTDVVAQVLGAVRVAALSGPSFALEVYQGQPTAVVAASDDAAAARATQRLFAARHFRVYTASDVTGVELGGALKNVIAIAAGMLEGMGLGHNTRAALITRGLAEIARLGRAMGADPLTFAGLAGMGDLILTTTGALSRNRALGLALASGESFADHSARHRTVAEGASTSRAAVALARREGVELPIAEEVAAILFEARTPRESLARLLERELKPEQWA